jgi:hypothetical protein
VAPEKDKRIWRALVFEKGGRQLAGSYAVAQGMVYVRSGEREKAAQSGAAPAELIARMMIAEIAGETKRGN